MKIKMPIGPLGLVTIFTEKDDIDYVTCYAKPDGSEYRDLPESTLTVIQCDTLRYATFVYIAAIGDEFDLAEIVTKIISLEINTTSLNVRQTIFRAV